MKNEETGEGWLEHWIVVGSVSEKAEEAIRLANGKVERMHSFNCHAMAVCFLYDDPPDDDIAYTASRRGDIINYDVYTANPDEHAQLVLYSTHINPDLTQADVLGLHLCTLEEYYAMHP